MLVAGMAIAVSLGAMLRAGGPERPSRWLNLDEPETSDEPSQAADAAGAPVLRVGIAPVISPEQSLAMYQAFAEHLARRTGRRAVVLQRQSYVETNELLRNRRCDLALVCTYAFIRGEREFGLQALVVPQIRGAVTYHSLIVVPCSSQAVSLSDLRGKRFASADLLSNSGWLYPAVWLTERKEDPERFFGQHIIMGSHDRSIEAVASQRVDGAAVDSLVYEQMSGTNPALAAKVKIVQKSPPFGMPPLVVHPQIDPELRHALIEALLGLHDDPAGQRLLAGLGIERFVVPEATLYQGVRENVDRWEARRP